MDVWGIEALVIIGTVQLWFVAEPVPSHELNHQNPQEYFSNKFNSKWWVKLLAPYFDPRPKILWRSKCLIWADFIFPLQFYFMPRMWPPLFSLVYNFWLDEMNYICYHITVIHILWHLPTVKSSPPSAADMGQWFGSALVQIIACRLFCAKPLSKPMLSYCSFGTLGKYFSEILIKIQNSSFTKMHMKIPSVKWQPFCPGGN